MIVTSCYIANINFTTLRPVKQVKTLKEVPGIISEKEGRVRPKFGRGGNSDAVFNNIDDQSVIFQFITVRIAQPFVGNHAAKA
ncbi:hypothetical protein TUM17577_17080 [Enterobacter asburiae]|nr:hypothetical protein TUM17577_17080 [Enterobacter asburiae]